MVAPVEVYNTTLISMSPSTATYVHEVTTLQASDPNAGAYDYIFEKSLDLNTLLANFVYKRDTGAQTATTSGEAAAWQSLHAELDAGALAATTTYSDADVYYSTSWHIFFAGLLSECINPLDKDGLSVKTDALQTALASYTDETQDIIGGINKAFQSNFGTQAIDTAPIANDNFLAALFVFIYQLTGVPDSGAETRVSADPSDPSGAQLALRPGDSLNIRISCSINNTKSGLIKLVQS
jgi:hypothetical protein